jgi:UDP-N-acetylglucosamine 2-epimerase (non-hydrolysing)
MKVAPLIRAIQKHNTSSPDAGHIEAILVHTGQHYDYEMSRVFFEDLELPEPDVYLGIGSGTHAEQTGKTMIEIEKVLIKENPDLVIVVGDVNSTLAGALSAVKLHIPVSHAEAGLRSYDRYMPEEINRLLTDHISDYLFTTSEYDDDNLRKEGISDGKVFRVGNVMADSLLFNIEMAKRSTILSRLGLKEQGYALLTLHRPSNVDDKESLTDILKAVVSISQRIPVVFPVHPRTRKNIDRFGLGHISDNINSQLILTEPLGYLSFLSLEMDARMGITDSGGMQVETTVLGIPCLTILDFPIWDITHEQGTNTLVGSDSRKLIKEAFQILDGGGKKGKSPELWDGKAAERIVGIISSIRGEKEA